MVPLELISGKERAKEKRGAKVCITGPSGVGKTSLVWTLPEKDTVFVDLEAGDLAIEGWQGTTVRPRTWVECRDIACILGGPNPSKRPDQPYSKDHYTWLTAPRGTNPDNGQRFETESEEKSRIESAKKLQKFPILFIDSITHAGRLCFQWCTTQPESFNKDGKVDTRGTYGLHGRDMIAWCVQLQHARDKDVIFACILDTKTDDFNRVVYSMQIEGAKTGIELPGIVDELITMAIIEPTDGTETYRGFVCQTINPWGYPAKDRAGRLDVVEKPHLGEMLKKLKGGRTKDLSETLNHDLPTTEPESDGVIDTSQPNQEESK